MAFKDTISSSFICTTCIGQQGEFPTERIEKYSLGFIILINDLAKQPQRKLEVLIPIDVEKTQSSDTNWCREKTSDHHPKIEKTWGEEIIIIRWLKGETTLLIQW